MRRMFCLAAVACIGLLTAACTTTAPAQTGTSPPPITATQNTLLDEKVLFGAEATYNVAAAAYLSADSRDQLSPTVKAQVRTHLVNAYAAILAARSAYAAGNASSFTEQIAAIGTLAAQAQRLLPAS